MGEYRVAVAGESFNNSDGSSRQAEIGRCRRGERVQLVREPDNVHDANCVRVLSARGIQIGNLAREAAEWVAPRMDRGGHVSAGIHRISDGGGRGRHGVVLWLATNLEDEPRAPGLLARLLGL